MSESIIDYVKKYGEFSFDEREMNDVDSLVLCQLSYLKFEGMVPGVRENKPFVTIQEVSQHPDYDKLFADERFEKNNRALFEAVAASKRFRGLKMNCYVNIVLTEDDFQTQFSAMTFMMEGGLLYIAYRGTDETIIGWKEDINMAFLSPVPGQAYSVKYLNMVVDQLRNPIILGGHSKGGNLAVYAAMKCRKAVQERIRKVYCMDGPGFRPEVLKEGHYERIADRTVKLVPQASIIGMLLEMDDHYKVVKSNNFGLMQHDPFSWMSKDGELQLVSKVDHSSILLKQTVNQWVYSMEPEKIKKVTDILFEVVQATNTDNLIDIEADYKSAMSAMRDKMTQLEEEDKEIVKQVFGVLLEMGGRNLKYDIKRKLKHVFTFRIGGTKKESEQLTDGLAEKENDQKKKSKMKSNEKQEDISE